MRYVTLAQILLFASVAFASGSRASCEVAKKSILSVSASGLAKVSNMGNIEMICRIPARPFPTKPGESRNGLRAAATVYEITANDTKKLVASEVDVAGGGSDYSDSEFVDFYVHIPLDSEQLDAQARRWLAKVEQSMRAEHKAQFTGVARKKMLETLRWLVNRSENRVGRFQVDCRVLDGSRVVGSDVVGLEVLFKRRPWRGL